MSEAEEGRNKRVLIPALIDSSRPPFAFRHIQSADLINWNGNHEDADYQELVQAVARLVPHADVPLTNMPPPTHIQPSARETLPSDLEAEGIQSGNVNSQPVPPILD